MVRSLCTLKTQQAIEVKPAFGVMLLLFLYQRQAIDRDGHHCLRHLG